MSIGYVQVTWFGIHEAFSCGLLVDLIPLSVLFHITLTMFLAILRCYMAEKVGQNKVPDDDKIERKFYQGLATISGMILVLLILAMAGIHSSFLAPKCYGEAFEKVNFDQNLTKI